MPILNNSLINIIISLALIYALLSILVSSLMELWNAKSRARGKHLREAITGMLNDSFNYDYGELFYEHFLIKGLSYDAKHPTQYISSALFADALIDILASQVVYTQAVRLINTDLEKGKQYELVGKIPPDLKGRFELSLAKMNASPFKDVIESFWLKSDGDMTAFKKSLEDWFNDQMDRVGGWFKYKTRTQSLLFGFMVAIGLNIDSLHLVKVLSMDTNLRNSLVNVADNVADSLATNSQQYANDASKQLKLFYNAIPDSVQKKVSDKPKSGLNYFIKKKDSAHYQQAVKYFKSDSLYKSYLDLADSVLGVTSSLNIPIGWSHNTPPVSWFNSSRPCNESASHNLNSYSAHRNSCRAFSSVIMYLIGIVISGFSLSLGAPFWFDILVKFVNVRRSGKRPETAKPTDS